MQNGDEALPSIILAGQTDYHISTTGCAYYCKLINECKQNYGIDPYILQYFTVVKNVIFRWKKCDFFFLNFAQNIDRRFTLEPPQWGGSNEYPRSMF